MIVVLVKKMSLKLNFIEISCLFACGFLIGTFIESVSVLNEVISLSSNDSISKSSAVEPDEEPWTADELFEEVRILCFVLTTEPQHDTKAWHVKNNWGRRCNRLIFASNVEDEQLGALEMVERDGRARLWRKVKTAMAHIYNNFYTEFDWVFKADDDTFAIIDNMRFMLSAYSPNDPIFFGKKFNCTERFGCFSGGAGYVMSREAVRRFIIESLPDPSKCSAKDNGAEDWELSVCMSNVQVYAGDARDRFQRETFFPFYPRAHLFPFELEWYTSRLYYKTKHGLDCCSNYTISFHYIEPNDMCFFEYLVHHLNVYGVRNVYEPLPEKKDFARVVQQLIDESVVVEKKIEVDLEA